MTPRASNKFLLGVLGPYGHKYAFTKAIIQKARDLARADIFGDPGNNAKYIQGLQDDLRRFGHYCEVMYYNRTQALNRLKLVVVAEAFWTAEDELVKRSLATKAGAKRYLNQWCEDNKSFINKHFGTERDNWRFVQGIAFATGPSRRTAPQLQQIIQADAAHMNFGKYTLYSAYGTTANAQSSPIAFAILFGNEDKDAWIKFWEFAKLVHPWLANGKQRGLTIITNQDKGSKEAIATVLPEAFNFCCSFHRRNNILGHCKGGVQPDKAAWVFNKLINAKTPEAIQRIKDDCFGRLAQRDVAYLCNLVDEEQYPAARCAMDRNVIMYGRSSSASVESMNAANKDIRERTSVCLVNSTMLLMNLERARYQSMKDAAWAEQGHLTPRGSMLADEAAKEVPSPRVYKWTVVEHPEFYQYKIKGNHPRSQWHDLRVVKEENYGIRGSSCTCGVHQVDGVPCRHAIAVAKSPAQRNGYTVLNSMPIHWTAATWRLQFPMDDMFAGTFDLDLLKERYDPDNSIHYCPEFAGMRKKGRPKKTSRAKSPLEIAMAEHNGSVKKKRRVRVSDEELAQAGREYGEDGGEGDMGYV